MDDFEKSLETAIKRAIVDEYAWGVRSLSDIAQHFQVTRGEVEEILRTFIR